MNQRTFERSNVRTASAASGEALPRVVLYVIGSLPPNGAERVLLDLVRHLDRARFRPVVCCLHAGGPLLPAFEAAGAKVVVLGKRSRWEVSILAKLRRVIAEEGPALIHTHLFPADAWGRAAALLAGVPAVSTAHSSDPWRGWHQRLADGILSRLTERVVAVSEGVARSRRERERVPAATLTTIPNGIDLDRFDARRDVGPLRAALGLPDGVRTVGIVGRLHPAKGHPELFEAVRQLLEGGLRLAVLAVGDGELRGELEGLARRLGLEGAVRFLGRRDDVAELLNVLDVYAMPSRWEGLPISLLEAMAASRPIVASAVGGIPEVITHGETGLLVPPGDPHALAAAVRRLLEAPEEARRMGEAARRAVRARFDVATMARRYEGLYEEVLAGPGPFLRRRAPGRGLAGVGGG
jgi:glycosyltransferase involved in cell wall biosynthesis